MPELYKKVSTESIAQDKLDLFLQVAGHLNQQLQITPVLYGSLGLGRAIGRSIGANDVDILVPLVFVAAQWNDLLAAMCDLGFVLHNVREHEFTLGEEHVAFAEEEDLLPFAQVDPATLMISTLNDVRFKALTPQQFLAVYRASLRDGYRQEKGKRDMEKIRMLEQQISSSR